MIIAGTLTPYAGDQSKPGAWTDAEIADWNRAATCDHSGFHQLDNPLRPREECPTCGAVLRSRTDAQGWVDHHAEQKAEDEAYRHAQLAEREEAR